MLHEITTEPEHRTDSPTPPCLALLGAGLRLEQDNQCHAVRGIDVSPRTTLQPSAAV